MHIMYIGMGPISLLKADFFVDMFQCATCGSEYSSRFALKRHRRKRHPAEPAPTVQSSVVPTKSAHQPNVPASSARPPNVPAPHSARSGIIRAVEHLKAEWRQRPALLAKRSAEIVGGLRQRAPGLKPDVYLAIVMAAKAFSGRSHRSEAVQTGKGAAPQQPRVRLGIDELITPYHVPVGPRQSRRGDPLLDCVRRKLPFTSSGSTPDVARDPEEEWRVQIWRCYGTMEIQPPSPFGLRWAPASIFSSREPTGAGPMSPGEGALVT